MTDPAGPLPGHPGTGPHAAASDGPGLRPSEDAAPAGPAGQPDGAADEAAGAGPAGQPDGAADEAALVGQQDQAVDEAAPSGPTTRHLGADGEPPAVTVRPRRIAVYAAISATVIVLTMVIVGIALRGTDLGVKFQWSDQIALIALGLLFAAAVLMMARPRLRADANGVWVRNIVGERYFPWPLVLRVAFPTGANWAQLQLPDDESHPVMAIQAMDRQRAVLALKAVRALHARYAPPPPEPPPEREARLLEQERNRPLGRLELIDQQMASGQRHQLSSRRRRRG